MKLDGALAGLDFELVPFSFPPVLDLEVGQPRSLDYFFVDSCRICGPFRYTGSIPDLPAGDLCSLGSFGRGHSDNYKTCVPLHYTNSKFSETC